MAGPRIYFPPETSAQERLKATAALTSARYQVDSRTVEFFVEEDNGTRSPWLVAVRYSRVPSICRQCGARWFFWLRDEIAQDSVGASESVRDCPVCDLPRASEMTKAERETMIREIAATGTDALAEMAVVLDQAQAAGKIDGGELAEAVRNSWHHPDDVAEIARLSGIADVAWREKQVRNLVGNGLISPSEAERMMRASQHGDAYQTATGADLDRIASQVGLVRRALPLETDRNLRLRIAYVLGLGDL